MFNEKVDMSMFEQEPEDKESERGITHQKMDTMQGKPILEDYNPESEEESELPYIPSMGDSSRSRTGTVPNVPRQPPTTSDTSMYFMKPPSPEAAIRDPRFAEIARNKSGGMNDLMKTLNGMGVNTVKANVGDSEDGTLNVESKVGSVKDSILMTIEYLENPVSYLPPGKEGLVPQLIKVANPVINALKSYSKFIEKFE